MRCFFSAVVLLAWSPALMVAADEAKTVVNFPSGGFHLEMPAPWVQMPPVVIEQVKMLLKQKLIGTPLERITFDTCLVRGGDFKSLLAGEYLIITASPDKPTPAMFATAYPQAKRETEKVTQFIWDDVVSDFGWEQLVFNPQRGMIVWPGKAKHFDGSVLKIKFYVFPTSDRNMILFAFGGNKQPDAVFAEIDTALGESPIRKELRQPPEWWDAFIKAVPSTPPPAVTPAK